jgi:predicted PurR-regulated permease PerM
MMKKLLQARPTQPSRDREGAGRQRERQKRKKLPLAHARGSGMRDADCLTFALSSRFIIFMSRVVSLFSVLLVLLTPALSNAIETAPPLSDREVIERLTRLEEGQKVLQQEMQQLRTDMNGQMQQLRQEVNDQIQQLRTDMNMQIQQLRTDMNAQFSHVFQLMVGMLGTFAAIVVVTISFALWDRRTMIRPFESKVKAIEEELSQNRQRFHALLEALRALSQKDKQVADVLKQFDLL